MFFCLSRQTVFYVFDSFIVFYDTHISLPTLPSSLFPLLIPLPAPVRCRSKITRGSPCGFPDSDTTISCGSVAGRSLRSAPPLAPAGPARYRATVYRPVRLTAIWWHCDAEAPPRHVSMKRYPHAFPVQNRSDQTTFMVWKLLAADPFHTLKPPALSLFLHCVCEEIAHTPLLFCPLRAFSCPPASLLLSCFVYKKHDVFPHCPLNLEHYYFIAFYLYKYFLYMHIKII